MSDNIILADRIKEISWTQDTSDFVLSGAANGFSSFDTVYSDGDILFYAATNGIEYEIGSGIFNDGGTAQDTITRMPFRSSITGNTKVGFGAGAKEIYVTYPATHSVYIGSGVSDYNFPRSSGIAFWSSSNILNYDNDIIWDIDNKRLGILKSNPAHGIDVGGDGVQSSIQASGFYVGNHGVVFPAQNNGDVNYVGGNQLVHFEPNELDSNTLIDSVIELSGTVDQIFLFKKQSQGTFLSGPATDSCINGACPEDYPTFRVIDPQDIPDLSSLYATLSDITEVSGILRSDLNLASGVLRSDLESGDIEQNNLLVSVSGELNSYINDLKNTVDVTINENDGTYIFNGLGLTNDPNPTLTLHKGMKYIFNVDSVGQNFDYPFFIKTLPSSDTLNQYLDGVINNGEFDGSIEFRVPQDAPDKLYYCANNSSSMSGVIFTANVNLDTFNDYDTITSADTDANDSVVIWDESDGSYKNITLTDLQLAPNNKSFIKYGTIENENNAGSAGEVSFDDNWMYFHNGSIWKRISIETFTTTQAPTTTWPPNCTTPAPCAAGEYRDIIGVISDPADEFDGCPIYSDCFTTTTTTAAPTTTLTTTPEPLLNSVFSWGDNSNNQLGFKTTGPVSSGPTRLDNIKNIIQVSTKDYHTLAISSTGKLYAWGWNDGGQLGNGTKVDVITPAIVDDSRFWSFVAAGSNHSAGVTSNGELYTWGHNIHGQLGNGTRIGCLSPTRIGNNSNWVKVYCGTSHTLAINSLGELFAWGSNEYGQVGNGSFEDVLSPVKVGIGYFWHDISAYMHTLAINSEGQLFGWGRNTENQLGLCSAETTTSTDSQGNVTQTTSIIENVENQSLPVSVSKSSSKEITEISLQVNAGALDNWTSVAAGYKHSLAINQAGEVYGAGTSTGINYTLGAGITVAKAFVKINDERNWNKVRAGNYHSFLINSAGILFASGKNTEAQLGLSNQSPRVDFTQISDDYEWEVSAGYDFTVGIGTIRISDITTTTSTTSTTEAPMSFTSSLTVSSSGSASSSADKVSITGGQESDLVEYNVPSSLGSLPITCLVYSNDVFIIAITVTNGYDGSMFRLTRGSAEYTFTIASGRIDI